MDDESDLDSATSSSIYAQERAVSTWPWSDSDANASPPASAFGALPSLAQAPATLSSGDIISFHFTTFNPTILNCTLYGPRSIVYYRPSTDPSQAPLCTLLKDNEGASAAVIEWSSRPYVQVRGLVSRRKVRDWLPLSFDRSSRIMIVNEVQYRWQVYGADLYLTSDDGSKRFGRVTKTHNLVTLELTHDAMYMSLLEVAVVATLLFQSGRAID